MRKGKEGESGKDRKGRDRKRREKGSGGIEEKGVGEGVGLNLPPVEA